MCWKYMCYYDLTYYKYGNVYQFARSIENDSLLLFAFRLIPIILRYKILKIEIRR